MVMVWIGLDRVGLEKARPRHMPWETHGSAWRSHAGVECCDLVRSGAGWGGARRNGARQGGVGRGGPGQGGGGIVRGGTGRGGREWW